MIELLSMKKLTIICLLFALVTATLFSKSLKIADSIIYKIPEGWNYVDSTKQSMPGLGILTSAHLENPTERQKLTVSVLVVADPVSGIQHSTELVEATLSPLIEAYRKQGSHYYPRKLLGRGNYIFYSQDVGRLKARKVELRGVLLKHGDNWVNFFCQGPSEISWKQYQELIIGTQLLR